MGLKGIAPELVVLVIGVLLLSVGLSAWLGWERAATVVGALMIILGSWSAAAGRARG